MASLFPLYNNLGSLTTATSSVVLGYHHFSVSASVSNSFQTNLPDPYYIQTQSAEVRTASNTASSSLFVFTQTPYVETLFFVPHALLGVRTTATTTGVRTGFQAAVSADASILNKVASTATAFTIGYQGTEDAFTFALPASMAAINTTYPAYVDGLLRNTTPTTFNNNILLQSEINNSGVTGSSGSLFVTRFLGFSSSVVPVTSSIGTLALSASYINALSGVDTVTQSVLPPTSSLWLSQSLATSVSTTVNTTFTNLFTLTGLTAGTTYYVEFYLIGSSAATTTGLQVRAVTGSAYRGTIYSPTSATAYSISSSSDINLILNASTAWPVINTKALVWGEYTFVKGANDPQLQLRSEIAGSAVTAFSGSVIFYRALN